MSKPKISKTYYSWQELTEDCQELAKKLKNKKFDFVVAVSRGGIIPATILVYLLKLNKIRIIGYSHYKADAVLKRLTSVLPLSSDIRDLRVLLVDDIVETGLTIEKAHQELIKRKNLVTTACIHFRICTNPVFKPDYFISDPGKDWVVYPWEPPFRAHLTKSIKK